MDERFEFYNKEVNYISDQIRKMFGFHIAFIDYNGKDYSYTLSFERLGNDTYLHKKYPLSLFELLTKSYKLIIKQIADFIMLEMFEKM